MHRIGEAVAQNFTIKVAIKLKVFKSWLNFMNSKTRNHWKTLKLLLSKEIACQQKGVVFSRFFPNPTMQFPFAQACEKLYNKILPFCQKMCRFQTINQMLKLCIVFLYFLFCCHIKSDCILWRTFLLKTSLIRKQQTMTFVTKSLGHCHIFISFSSFMQFEP